MFRNPTTDLIVVLVIVLLIFGPKRLPGLGRSLGGGLREFKDSITGDSTSEEEFKQSGLPRGDDAPSPPLAPASGTDAGTQPAPSAVRSAGAPEGSSERRS